MKLLPDDPYQRGLDKETFWLVLGVMVALITLGVLAQHCLADVACTDWLLEARQTIH